MAKVKVITTVESHKGRTMGFHFGEVKIPQSGILELDKEHARQLAETSEWEYLKSLEEEEGVDEGVEDNDITEEEEQIEEQKSSEVEEVEESDAEEEEIAPKTTYDKKELSKALKSLSVSDLKDVAKQMKLKKADIEKSKNNKLALMSLVTKHVDVDTANSI